MLFLYKLSLVFALSAHGADLASTEHCLGAGRCREMNPALARFTQPAIFGAAKMGVAGAGLLGTHELHTNHPKLATVLNLAVGAGFSAVAYHNTKVSNGTR